MDEPVLMKILPNHIDPKVLRRNNRYKKWKYGYDEDHDIIYIGKTGEIGDVYEIQNLKIALPKAHKDIIKYKNDTWERTLIPKVLNKIKTIFDWGQYPDDFKEKW